MDQAPSVDRAAGREAAATAKLESAKLKSLQRLLSEVVNTTKKTMAGGNCSVAKEDQLLRQVVSHLIGKTPEQSHLEAVRYS